jgi:hypothetical protein
MVKQKAKTKNFKDFLFVSIDEIFNLGKSEQAIGDLFLNKIISNSKGKNFVWHKNQFEYVLWGARGEVAVFSVVGVLEERAAKPVKSGKASKKIVLEPVVPVVSKSKKKEADVAPAKKRSTPNQKSEVAKPKSKTKK